MSVYTAYLRVYEPLAAFPAADAKRWRRYVEEGSAPDRRAAAAAEHRTSVTRVVAPRQASADGSDDAVPPALVIVEDGMTYVCPLDLARRCADALEEFREGLPPVVADAFVPPALSNRVAAELAGADEDRPVHVQSARWQVPLRWFVPFEPAERTLILGPRAERYAAVAAPPASELARGVAYLTAMARARRRIARTLAVLRRTLEDGSVVDGVESLGRWLEEFHPHSLVELDYGGLVHLLDDDALRGDSSVEDIAAAVDALRRGDAEATTAAYERVVARWHPVAATESAN